MNTEELREKVRIGACEKCRAICRKGECLFSIDTCPTAPCDWLVRFHNGHCEMRDNDRLLTFDELDKFRNWQYGGNAHWNIQGILQTQDARSFEAGKAEGRQEVEASQ